MPRSARIWLFALGYFACYAPYSALTKALSSGSVPGVGALDGFAILPFSTVTSLVGMFVFIALSGWWRSASPVRVLGLELKGPTRHTFVSGLCSAAIIATTTLSYALTGTSIVFMMLLMRGGVIVIAPIVDLVARRHVRSMSWVALALSLAAVVVATTGGFEARVSALAIADVSIYLFAYFFRLRFMSHLAKSGADASRRYFVEEQLVATPAVVLVLALAALFGRGEAAGSLVRGFTALAPAQLAVVCAIGLLSQGTGIFGALILLDDRESSFCVPVNRASSILAGVLATFSLAAFGGPAVGLAELAGAGLVIAAIIALAAQSLWGRRPPTGNEHAAPLRGGV